MNRACYLKNTNLHEQKQYASSIRPIINNLAPMKKIILLAAALLLQKTFAQTIQVPSNLKTLVEQSFQKYPRVEAMNEAVHLSEVRVELEKAGYLPIASADASYRRLYPTPSVGLPIANNQTLNVQFFPADNYTAQLNITQPIIDFNTSAKIGKAKSDLTTTTDNLESVKTQVAYQIAQIYYGIIFLNKSLVVQQGQLDLLNDNLNQIDVKVKNGVALKYDLLSTKVQYTNTENIYTDLQDQLDRQYNALNVLTGHTDTKYINDTTIDRSTFDMVTDSVLSLAASRNPDIRVAKDKISAANWDIISANRKWLPTMSLQAGAGYKNGFIPDIGNIHFNYLAGVGISIPIMPASRPSLQRQMAEINMNTTKLDLTSQTLTLTKDVLNALNDVKKNETKLSRSDIQVLLAQEALQLANQRYKEGVNTNLDLLTAQTNYQNAMLSKLQFEYNLILSKMQVNQLAGSKWW